MNNDKYVWFDAAGRRHESHLNNSGERVEIVYGMDMASTPDRTHTGFYQLFPEVRPGTEPLFKNRPWRLGRVERVEPLIYNNILAEIQAAMADSAKQLGVELPPNIGDSKVNNTKGMLIMAAAAVAMSIRYYEAKGRKPSALGQLAVDIDECIAQGGKFKFSGPEMAMIADAADRAEGFYAATGAALHRRGEFIALRNWAKSKITAGLHVGENFGPPPEPKPPVPALGDYIEIRPNQPIAPGPNKTRGTKVLVRGCEVKGVSRIDIECATNDVWKARIECFVQPPEVIPAKVVGVTQNTINDAARVEVETTNLDSATRQFAMQHADLQVKFDRGAVTFTGRLSQHGGSPLDMYRATAAASAKKATEAALESMRKDGWKTPSINYDELFRFIRDVTLNAK